MWSYKSTPVMAQLCHSRHQTRHQIISSRVTSYLKTDKKHSHMSHRRSRGDEWTSCLKFINMNKTKPQWRKEKWNTTQWDSQSFCERSGEKHTGQFEPLGYFTGISFHRFMCWALRVWVVLHRPLLTGGTGWYLLVFKNIFRGHRWRDGRRRAGHTAVTHRERETEWVSVCVMDGEEEGNHSSSVCLGGSACVQLWPLSCDWYRSKVTTSPWSRRWESFHLSEETSCMTLISCEFICVRMLEQSTN